MDPSRQSLEAGLSIGTVSRRAGVGIDTIRYYERRGLLAKPQRRPSGYRLYDEQVIQRLRFVRRAKELGFTLDEIGELLSLKLDPARDCSGVKKTALARLADIEGKIRSLQRMRRTLKKVSTACSGKGSTSDCPILEALETPRKGK